MSSPVLSFNIEEAVEPEPLLEGVEEQLNAAVGLGAEPSPQGARGRSVARYILYQYNFVCLYIYFYLIYCKDVLIGMWKVTGLIGSGRPINRFQAGEDRVQEWQKETLVYYECAEALLTWFIKVWVKIGLCVKHKLMLIKSGILGNSFEVFTVIVCYNIIIVVV